MLKINNKIALDEKEYKWIIDLEYKKNKIYYILEGLIKVIRYCKKTTNYSNNMLDINMIEDLECGYTESYFKIIIREQYILNNNNTFQLLFYFTFHFCKPELRY